MSLEYDNKVALELIQAMLGALSSNVRAVSFQCNGRRIELFFVFEKESSTDREEADYILVEFEALQSGPVDIEHHIKVTEELFPNGVSSLKGRPLYARKEN